MNIATGTTATSIQQREAWSRRAVPEVEQVGEGIWAIPVPVLRIPIKFTYTYLIVSSEEVILIDPGAESAEGERALEEGMRAAGLAPSALTGIVITHYHFDHWEAADRLAERTGAWIAIGEHEQAWVDRLTDDAVTPEIAAARFAGLGVPAQRAAEFAAVEDYRYTRDHTRPTVLLRDGDLLPVGAEALRVLWTPGHSPGHVCVHDERRGILFSGDHILPGITPHIALNPFGAADPLAQYLDSLELVKKLDDPEVLPAHEYRFAGLGVRVDELRGEVERRVSEVNRVLQGVSDARAWDVASALTWSREWSAFSVESQRMAVVETAAFLAHARRD